MPVIGRLDEQVNEVLIRPLSDRRAPDDAPPPPQTPAADTSDEPAGRKQGPDDNSKKDGLPVWLL